AATRERIRASAEALGYRSNALARALVQGRTGQLGVVVTDLTNPYHADVALGVEEAATRQGLGALIAHGRRDPARLAAHLEAMLSLNVDGLVVVSSRVRPEVLATCARQVPVVVVGRPEELPAGVDAVANHDAAGARLAVAHLAQLGHREIGFVTTSRRPTARARHEGYAQALVELDLGAERTWTVEGPEEVAGALTELLAAGCTAVLGNNDLTAVALLDHAHDAGLDLPGGLSVVGYDDTRLATTVRPRLTSLDQGGAALGAAAVELLGERDAGRREDRHLVLEPTLRARTSTGPPTGQG
ncbi:LacI family DNA-binding transcriptional regulator, partial [Actinotalea sp. C106]|uniref:LacI family DNA-binding transcriptional regulator n=1 Tax=Actinotalea sp. C106 TaxID=2908644 RepID=UPI00202988A3